MAPGDIISSSINHLIRKASAHFRPVGPRENSGFRQLVRVGSGTGAGFWGLVILLFGSVKCGALSANSSETPFHSLVAEPLDYAQVYLSQASWSVQVVQSDRRMHRPGEAGSQSAMDVQLCPGKGQQTYTYMTKHGSTRKS